MSSEHDAAHWVREMAAVAKRTRANIPPAAVVAADPAWHTRLSDAVTYFDGLLPALRETVMEVERTRAACTKTLRRSKRRFLA